MKLTSLYDVDYQCWLAQTAAQLRAHDFGNLDLENLIEEIESLGKSDKRALSSYLLRLCEHLLKLRYWESERELCFRGWILEINNFRLEIELILEDSPSLKPFLTECFLSSYQKARKNILKSAVPSSFIPQEPEFTLEQALDEDWLPSWQPEQLLPPSPFKQGDSIMDRLEHYRQSIRQFLDKYADIWREKDVETQLVIDSERDHYLLLRVGWDGDKRINYPVFHFDIKNGKIWVQENNTDVELDKDFEEMGISKKEIVVGFHHPLMREYSDYATA